MSDLSNVSAVLTPEENASPLERIINAARAIHQSAESIGLVDLGAECDASKVRFIPISEATLADLAAGIKEWDNVGPTFAPESAQLAQAHASSDGSSVSAEENA